MNLKRNFCAARFAARALLLLFALLAFFSAAGAADLRFCALDVGQGDCAMFITPDERVILIDAGTVRNAENTVKFLKEQGIKKIDLLVATHPHEDHIGGMMQILRNFPVERIWDSGYNHGSKLQLLFYKAVRDAAVTFQRPKRGYSEQWRCGAGSAEVGIEILSPQKNPLRCMLRKKSSCNNSSVVLRIKYGNVSFLMMGDLELDGYKAIAPLPHANIIKIAHHGSSNATDEALLREVSPDIAILSYGADNKYGHPHTEVTQALKSLGIMRTDTADGAVWLATDGKFIKYDKKRVVR